MREKNAIGPQRNSARAMMRAVQIELRRAVVSRSFAAAVAGFCLCAFLGAWRILFGAIQGETLQEPMYTLYSISDCLSSRYLLLALPVLAALPYAGSFVEDRQNRFLRSYVPRCGRKAFLAARTTATALSGAAVMAAGSALVCIIMALLILPTEMRPDPLQAESVNAMQLAAVGDIAWKTLLLALSGALWALVGSAVAVLGNNRHLALAGPFILYYILVILSTRYFPDLETLNPQGWASGAGIWLDMPFAAGLLSFELALAAGFVLALCMERGLRDV